MLFNIILTKNIPKKSTSILFRPYSSISRSAATTSNIETVNLVYSTYDYCDKTSTKPPLVILHAMFGSRNNWDSMSKAIHETTGRRVISIDARNHGDSEHSLHHTYFHQAHDVIEVLKKLKLTKVSLLGHCMGGNTAAVLTLIRPDLVSSLAIEDISPIKMSRQALSMVHLFDGMATMPIKFDISMTEARELADEHLKTVTDDVNIRNYLTENLVKANNGSYIWRLNIPSLKNNFLKHVPFPNSLKGYKYPGPVLFIAGSQSEFIGKYDLPKIQEYFPSAELTFVNGAGHWVHSKKPEEFHALVSKFLLEK